MKYHDDGDPPNGGPSDSDYFASNPAPPAHFPLAMRDRTMYVGHIQNVTAYWITHNHFTSDCIKWCDTHIQHKWNMVSGTCVPHARDEMHVIFEDQGDLIFFTWSFLESYSEPDI